MPRHGQGYPWLLFLSIPPLPLWPPPLSPWPVSPSLWLLPFPSLSMPLSWQWKGTSPPLAASLAS